MKHHLRFYRIVPALLVGILVSTLALVGVPRAQATVAFMAVDDSYSTDVNTPLDIPFSSLMSNDSYPVIGGLPVEIYQIDGPDVGNIAVTNGTISYTPPADWSGTASFRYNLQYGLPDCDSVCDVSTWATVTITVGTVNQPPVAVDDNYSTDMDQPLSLTDLMSNDSIPAGDTVYLSEFTNATFGNAFFPDLVYFPPAGWSGTDSFQYRLYDDTTGEYSNWATVTITVRATNFPFSGFFQPVDNAPRSTRSRPARASRSSSAWAATAGWLPDRRLPGVAAGHLRRQLAGRRDRGDDDGQPGPDLRRGKRTVHLRVEDQ